MSSLESFFSGRIETPDETGLSNTELLNQTEVSNFELSEFIPAEDIIDYVRETIPLSHLENCPSIRYEPEGNELYPFARGTFDRATREICVWEPREGFVGPQEVLGTLTHEIGHNVHENILDNRPEVAEQWAELHLQSLETYEQEGSGFVTNYARTNMYEDFAETYGAYVRDPEKLKFFNPDKYEFMRDQVFSGEEYPERLVGGYYLPTDNTYPWSTLDENGTPIAPRILFDEYYTTCGP